MTDAHHHSAWPPLLDEVDVVDHVLGPQWPQFTEGILGYSLSAHAMIEVEPLSIKAVDEKDVHIGTVLLEEESG